MPETTTIAIDVKKMFRDNLFSIIRASAVLGMVATVYEDKGHHEESEALVDAMAVIGAINSAAIGMSTDQFATLVEQEAYEVAVASAPQPVLDKLDA